VRIGFLFNHDQIHQVAHSLPIALALARCGAAEIVVATTNRRLDDEVDRLTAIAGCPPLTRVRLRPKTVVSRTATALLDTIVPASKIVIYRDNLDFFRSLDALVVAEKTSTLLKSRYRLDLPLIHTRHGAGDRAIGFDRKSALFDLVLASGPLIRDRLVRDVGVDPARIAIVGYAKFDIVDQACPSRLPFQANGRPTVLYNPHVSPHLSSWYRYGREVLELFYRSEAFNLIFAPHVMLFERPFQLTIDRLRLALPGRVDPKYTDAPHFHVDLGSPASTDMSYTRAADIYLGDVSSQVYEFVRTPRPCVFLDAHETDYRDNPHFAHWRLGDVATTIYDLAVALDAAFRRHADYRDIQRQAIAERFDLTDTPSAERAATAILDFVGTRSRAVQA
jgi:hypothetical protein